MIYVSGFLMFLSVILAFLSYSPELSKNFPEPLKSIYDFCADLNVATILFLIGFSLLFIFV